MKPGIYPNISNEEYHADLAAISKTSLDLIDKSPAHYKWALENGKKSSDAKTNGQLVHMLVLEPTRFPELYAVLPADAPRKPTSAQRNAKKPSQDSVDAIIWWDNWEAKNRGKTILSVTDLEEAQRIVAAVHANPVAMRILEQAHAFEESIFAEDFETGVLCKCRPDIRIDGALYDLKTTRNAQPRSFGYACRNYRYHVQAAFYTDLNRMAGREVERFGFIAVDTADMPYQCTVFHRLAEEAIDQGREEYRRNLRTYAECMEKNEWPGYAYAYDVLDLSGLAENDPHEIEELEMEDIPEFAMG